MGSTVYIPNMTVLPVMGQDLSEQTIGFLEEGEVPTLRLLKASGKYIPLNVNFDGFSNLLVSEVGSVIGNIKILPEEFALHPAYPNPFNPVTTIEISVPEMVETYRDMSSLQVFDINGH